MAGRKFNFNAAEENNTPEKKAKKQKSEPINTNETLQGKAGTLAQELVTASMPKAFDFRFVPRAKIQFYSENEYPQENIESLAEKILNEGLIHNLEVFYLLDTDTYILDSGERRCRALDMLIEKYSNYGDTESEDYKKYLLHVKQFEKGYPCKVILSTGSTDSDNLDLRIRHYVANEEVRERNPAETAKRIADLNQLYSMRNQERPDKKININKKIGEDLGISDRQVKKYKSIQKLIPDLQKKFEENEITLTEGSNYSSLSKEEQKQLLKLINEGANKNEINSLYENISIMKKSLEEKEQEIRLLEKEKNEIEQQMQTSEAHKESNNHKELLESKEEEIKKLKEQLSKERENPIPADGYPEALKLKIQIEHVKKETETLLDYFESYKESYNAENTFIQTPEEYLEMIKKLLKNTLEKIK